MGRPASNDQRELQAPSHPTSADPSMHGLDGYGAIVPFSLLLPALAVIIALGSLTLGLRSVERELGTLRSSLRRSTATAVATNDLVRASDQLSERALAQIDDARLRLGRRPQWWSQDPNGRR